MEKRDKKIKDNKKKIRQRNIILIGNTLIIIAIVCLIIINKSNKKKEEFLSKAMNVFSVTMENISPENNIIFSSNSINSLHLDDKNIKYCITYSDNNIVNFDMTDGNYYISVKNQESMRTSKVKKGNYKKFKCNSPLPVLAASGYNAEKNDRKNVFGYEMEASKIESIEFVTTNVVPEKTIGRFDASLNKDGSVMAWYKDEDKNGKYELFIGGNGGVSTGEDASYLFAGLYNTKLIDTTNLDTMNAITMKGMFYYLVELEELNISNIDTTKVEDMSYMFYYLVKLSSLELNNFDTRNVTNMSNMFRGLWAMSSINLTEFDTSKVEDMSEMFKECSMLRDAILKYFDFSSVKNVSEMFSGDYLLHNIEIDSFKLKNNVNVKNMFCLTPIKVDDELLNKLSNKQREDVITCADN